MSELCRMRQMNPEKSKTYWVQNGQILFALWQKSLNAVEMHPFHFLGRRLVQDQEAWRRRLLICSKLSLYFI